MEKVSFEKFRVIRSQRKKVLWVMRARDLSANLNQKSKMEVMRSLAQRGFISTFVALRSKNFFQARNSQIRFISIPLKSVPVITPFMYAIAMFFFLPFHILISRPDYIITDPHVSVFSLGLVTILSKLRGMKLILDIRSTPVEVTGFRGFLNAHVFATSVTFAKRFFDGITVITPLMKKEICKRFEIDPKRVGVWSSGVSMALFNPVVNRSRGEILRRELGLTEKFVVFYHGGFSATRGLAETMEAMSIVKNENCDVVFFLLGKGSFDQRLRDLIQTKGLQDNVIIHDPVEQGEVPKYIAMCDIGIVPLPDHAYWRAQSPLKLLEYLAMSKVIVLTSIPAHRSIVGKNLCGIYTSSDSPGDIAQSIMYAYRNREKLESWGISGRKIVEEGYTWEKVAADLASYLFLICDVYSKS